MISMFLNSRGRSLLLNNFLISVVNTVSNIDDIEILIRIDSDDSDTINLFKDAVSDCKIRIFQGPRPKNLTISYNYLASKCKGDYLFVMNDDINIMTHKWDEIVNTVDPNEIWFLSTNDSSVDKEQDQLYSSFPLLTRAAYEALGYYMPDCYVGLGADVHLWRIFKEINRIISLDINVDHLYHNTVPKVLNPDIVAAEMRMNSRTHPVNPWTMDITNEVNRIKNKLLLT